MSKRILILLGLVIAFTLLIFFFENPFQSRFVPMQPELFYPLLNPEGIASIEIENFIQGTRFEKDDQGRWFVLNKKTELQKKIEQPPEIDKKPQRFLADEKAIQQIINTVASLRKQTLVSTNPENQGRFQVAPVGMKVTFSDKEGKKPVRFFIGKQGPNFFSNYIRDDGSDHVYLVEENLKILLNRKLEDWKKKEEEEEEQSSL